VGKWCSKKGLENKKRVKRVIKGCRRMRGCQKECADESGDAEDLHSSGSKTKHRRTTKRLAGTNRTFSEREARKPPDQGRATIVNRERGATVSRVWGDLGGEKVRGENPKYYLKEGKTQINS